MNQLDVIRRAFDRSYYDEDDARQIKLVLTLLGADADYYVWKAKDPEERGRYFFDHGRMRGLLDRLGIQLEYPPS